MSLNDYNHKNNILFVTQAVKRREETFVGGFQANTVYAYNRRLLASGLWMANGEFI